MCASNLSSNTPQLPITVISSPPTSSSAGLAPPPTSSSAGLPPPPTSSSLGLPPPPTSFSTGLPPPPTSPSTGLPPPPRSSASSCGTSHEDDVSSSRSLLPQSSDGTPPALVPPPFRQHDFLAQTLVDTLRMSELEVAADLESSDSESSSHAKTSQRSPPASAPRSGAPKRHSLPAHVGAKASRAKAAFKSKLQSAEEFKNRVSRVLPNRVHTLTLPRAFRRRSHSKNCSPPSTSYPQPTAVSMSPSTPSHHTRLASPSWSSSCSSNASHKMLPPSSSRARTRSVPMRALTEGTSTNGGIPPVPSVPLPSIESVGLASRSGHALASASWSWNPTSRPSSRRRMPLPSFESRRGSLSASSNVSTGTGGPLAMSSVDSDEDSVCPLSFPCTDLPATPELSGLGVKPPLPSGPKPEPTIPRHRRRSAAGALTQQGAAAASSEFVEEIKIVRAAPKKGAKFGTLKRLSLAVKAATRARSRSVDFSAPAPAPVRAESNSSAASGAVPPLQNSKMIVMPRTETQAVSHTSAASVVFPMRADDHHTGVTSSSPSPFAVKITSHMPVRSQADPYAPIGNSFSNSSPQAAHAFPHVVLTECPEIVALNDRIRDLSARIAAGIAAEDFEACAKLRDELFAARAERVGVARAIATELISDAEARTDLYARERKFELCVEAQQFVANVREQLELFEDTHLSLAAPVAGQHSRTSSAPM